MIGRLFLTSLCLGFSALQVAHAGLLYAVQEHTNQLVTIDTTTFQKTVIGPLDVAFNFGGMAYDQNSDTLYMIDGRGAESLHTIDRTTGAVTTIGAHGIEDLFGLAYDPFHDVLYASGESPQGVYTLDVSTGQATLVGQPGVGLDGLAYDTTRDELIGLYAGPGDLYGIDPSNAASSLLLDGTFINNNGLAYDYEQDLYWSVDWDGRLVSYDPNDNYAMTLHMYFADAHDGLTFISSAPNSGPGSGSTPAPAPATLSLLMLGLAGLHIAKRKSKTAA